MFEDLDDLVLTIEGRLLDKLTQALSDVPAGADPSDKVRRLAEVYVEFTRENPKLWNLLFEHHLPAGREVPAWYREKLEGLMSKVEDALQPLARDVDPETVRRSAKTLWAGVHGITSLSTADKLQIISTDSAGALLDDLVSTHLAGLEAMRHRQAETSP